MVGCTFYEENDLRRSKEKQRKTGEIIISRIMGHVNHFMMKSGKPAYWLAPLQAKSRKEGTKMDDDVDLIFQIISYSGNFVKVLRLPRIIL